MTAAGVRAFYIFGSYCCYGFDCLFMWGIA